MRGSGAQSDCEQAIPLLHKLQSLLQDIAEYILFQNQMIGRERGNDRLRIEGEDMMCGPADAGGCVAACRLKEDIALLDIGKLFADDISVSAVGHQYYIIGRNEGEDAVNGHLKERSPCAEEIKELLRTVVAAQRPETGSDASTHYDTISMVHWLGG